MRGLLIWLHIIMSYFKLATIRDKKKEIIHPALKISNNQFSSTYSIHHALPLSFDQHFHQKIK
jgi:predicted metal-dependent peptidase